MMKVDMALSASGFSCGCVCGGGGGGRSIRTRCMVIPSLLLSSLHCIALVIRLQPRVLSLSGSFTPSRHPRINGANTWKNQGRS